MKLLKQCWDGEAYVVILKLNFEEEKEERIERLTGILRESG